MSKIEWTDETWNPTRGCTRVSPGCENCYAERQAHRQNQVGTGKPSAYFGLTEIRQGRPAWTGQIRLVPEKLDEPVRWRKPRRVFVDSMSDLFHEDVTDEFIQGVFQTMESASWHTFQILTKRSERLAGLALDLDWPPNVWMGVSIETAEYLWRANHLRKVPAAVRFLSLEPLLGPLGTFDLSGIHWVIVGGESGPGARPCDIAWIRDIVRQCRGAKVPVFVKQLGAKPYAGHWEYDYCCERCHEHPGQHHYHHDGISYPLRSRKGADPSEWPEDLRVREFPG
jgi:protein gp37